MRTDTSKRISLYALTAMVHDYYLPYLPLELADDDGCVDATAGCIDNWTRPAV